MVILKALPFIASVLAAAASPLSTELDISATAAFPPSNPFAHVVNGERNKMSVEIENKSELNVTLKSAGGSIHDPDTGRFLKNTTASTYGVALVAGAKTILPYTFYSEYTPKEVLLKIWVTYEDGSSSTIHRTMAYDSVVTIVEPKGSWFDLPLLFSYAIILSVIGSGAYYLYKTYGPRPKRSARAPRPKTSKSQISAPVGIVTANATGGKYEEEWIPAHHMPKKQRAKAEGAASSGDDSGADSRKAKRVTKKTQ